MQKPSLVLLHGFGLNAHVFDAVAPLLTPHFELVTPNLPGFGGEPEYHTLGDPDKTLRGWASWLLEQIPDTCHIAGWSMGSLVAIKAHALAPERFNSTTLITGSPCFAQKSDWPDAMRPELLHQFTKALKQDPKLTLRRFLALQFLSESDGKKHREAILSAVEQLPAATSDALTAGLEILREVDLRNTVATIPHLNALYGRLDTLVPAKQAESLPLLNKGCKIKVMPKMAHAPFWSAPDDFANTLKQWLL